MFSTGIATDLRVTADSWVGGRLVRRGQKGHAFLSVLRIARLYVAPPVEPHISPWANVPYAMQSTVRSYINSENDKDKERAMVFCKNYQLDYQTMRAVIMQEMIEESRIIAERKEREGKVAPARKTDRRNHGW